MTDMGFVNALNLTPKNGYCNDVKIGNITTKKTIWLVPHVIRHKENDEIITWRCNWGNVCTSRCVYAMSKVEEGNLYIAEFSGVNQM